MSDYASSTDIAAMWRDLTPVEVTRADVLCGYASEIMRNRVPTLDDRIASGACSAVVARLVCVQMVTRVLRNPAGVAAETVGPWSVQYELRANTEAIGRLVLTPDDLALLTGTPPGARSGYVAAVYSANRFAPRPGRRAWDCETLVYGP